MSSLDVSVQICLAGVFSATLVTLVFYIFMDRQIMLCKTNLPCSLIITQCAGIFLVFMSRLDVSVQSSCAGVFSATLITFEFDMFMDTSNWFFNLPSAETLIFSLKFDQFDPFYQMTFSFVRFNSYHVGMELVSSS